jgi:hypothetical protein
MALDLDAVTRADAARRDARNASELIDLAESFYGSGGSDGYLVSRGLTGTPENHNRVIRASENSFDRMARLGWSECVSYDRNGTASVFRRKRAEQSATSSEAREAIAAREARRFQLLARAGLASFSD